MSVGLPNSVKISWNRDRAVFTIFSTAVLTVSFDLDLWPWPCKSRWWNLSQMLNVCTLHQISWRLDSHFWRNHSERRSRVVTTVRLWPPWPRMALMIDHSTFRTTTLHTKPRSVFAVFVSLLRPPAIAAARSIAIGLSSLQCAQIQHYRGL